GVMLMDISQKSSAFDILKEDDILLSIDGHSIENDGTVEFLEQQFTSYKYYIDKKQLGESVTFGVLREGKIMKLKVKLTNIADDNLLVNTLEHDVMPRYFIYDGYVFTPLSRNLIVRSRSSLLSLREAANKWATDEKEEVVILLKVLADKTNRGDHNFSLWIVDMVNSKKFKNFDEFKSIINDFKGKYLILENEDGVKIAIERDKALKVEKNILIRYSIKSSQNE
ncbi:MAG: serine protease, partial [Epsilonproteobacteria bacterium]